jgi:hypothetical protein
MTQTPPAHPKAPLDFLADCAQPLLWRARPQGFYRRAVADLLAARGGSFEALTVADLVALSDSAAALHADALARELNLAP